MAFVIRKNYLYILLILLFIYLYEYYKVHIVQTVNNTKILKKSNVSMETQIKKDETSLQNNNEITKIIDVFDNDSSLVDYAIMNEITSANIYNIQQIKYENKLKSPCFYVKEGPSRKLMCLPYFILAGFTKCGSSDFYSKLSLHQHIFPPRVKEPHFWDDLDYLVFRNEHSRKSFAAYLDDYNQLATSITNLCDVNGNHSITNQDNCPYISGDFTPRTAWDADFWNENPENKNLDQPNVLTPHKIFKLLPRVKIIFLLRNPVDAVFSNYRYNAGQDGSGEEFHKKVKEGIKWWENCRKHFPERRCAYGLDYPPPVSSLNPMGPFVSTDSKPPRNLFWKYSSIDRMRIYFYCIHLEEWLLVFPKEQILVLKFEDYIKNPYEVMNSKVFPFLGMQPYNGESLTKLSQQNNIDNQGISSYKMLTKTKKLLQDFYEPYNERLQQLLDTNDFDWFQ